jgi:hypothetical protein
VLGLNGNAITFSPALAEAVRAPQGGLGDPHAIGRALGEVAKRRRLRFGVVHRYSSHNYMLRYWLSACGVAPDRDVEIATVAPPFVADALASGEIDGTCVGEPWNSVAVERGVGRIVLATAQVWRRGVEKVLALRQNRLDERREAVEHRRPTHVADEFQLKALLGGEAMLGCQNRQASVDEREETDGQPLAHSPPSINSCAVTTASATSAIRRLASIALRLSSA